MPAPHATQLGNALSGMSSGPSDLARALAFYASQGGRGGLTETALVAALRDGPNNPVRILLQEHLSRWDWDPAADWAAGSSPNTKERRNRIYALLRVRPSIAEALTKAIPHYQGRGDVLIEAKGSRKDWYTSEFRALHRFYFDGLCKHLDSTKGLDPDAIRALDAATTRIMARLSDPRDPAIRPVRGLVVGHVQSGKTTHFTGLAAKAIDAGYRLVIVLSGTTNLLRNQSQRRMDMDLVGIENIIRGNRLEDAEHDYAADDDWPTQFVRYGRRPSLAGQPDIIRVTGMEDFVTTGVGVNQMEFDFEKRDRSAPLYEVSNLYHTSAKLVVIKKQKDRLTRLLRELRSVGAGCNEVPALIIDDESDQASVNTLEPRKRTEDKERTKINQQLVKLLSVLPRAQYVGYTATPIANVFVNLSDPADIYPRDFILALQPPAGYMGATSFHDFDPPVPGRMGNEKAFVRDVPAAPENAKLAEAIDAFVLSAALKQFRSKASGKRLFKHHTMLVHQSQSTAHHERLADEVRRTWASAGYRTLGPGVARLEKLFENDFRKVWEDRGKPKGLVFPRSFRELKGSLGKALEAIASEDPVLVVNSTEDGQTPDFERSAGVWKIILGGAKLSRGYTIEGLTVSYFRRRSRVQDTLMQMGRWFGYRKGYEDLVRLYIGRNEPVSKTATIDLYHAFATLCRDQEAFREQLAIYETPSDGSPPITPAQVPALVFNSHPQLRPTARNKMFNAALTWAGFTAREPTNQAFKGDDRKQNARRFDALLSSAPLRTSVVQGPGLGRGLKVRWLEREHREMVKILKGIDWTGGASSIDAELAFLERPECQVTKWVILLPQLGGAASATWPISSGEMLTVSKRSRPSKSRFGVFSDPTHVGFAKYLVGERDKRDYRCTDLKPTPTRGVLLVYPTIDSEESAKAAANPVIGFAIHLPTFKHSGRAAFVVRVPSREDDVVVSPPKRR